MERNNLIRNFFTFFSIILGCVSSFANEPRRGSGWERLETFKNDLAKSDFSIDHPFKFDGQSYFWDGFSKCDMNFNKMFAYNFANGQQNEEIPNFNGKRPEKITWECATNEKCCGIDCCPKNSSADNIGIIIIIIIILMYFSFLCAIICTYTKSDAQQNKWSYGCDVGMVCFDPNCFDCVQLDCGGSCC